LKDDLVLSIHEPEVSSHLRYTSFAILQSSPASPANGTGYLFILTWCQLEGQIRLSVSARELGVDQVDVLIHCDKLAFRFPPDLSDNQQLCTVHRNGTPQEARISSGIWTNERPVHRSLGGVMSGKLHFRFYSKFGLTFADLHVSAFHLRQCR